MLLRSGHDYAVPTDDDSDNTTTTTVARSATFADGAETLFLSSLELVGRGAYTLLSPLVRWAYSIHEPFPFLALPDDIREQIYEYALCDHTSIRIADNEIRSVPHPLPQTSYQVRQEALEVADNCPVHVTCELASLQTARAFLKPFDNKYPRQRHRLRIRVYAGGYLVKDADIHDDYSSEWQWAIAKRQFRGVSTVFLPKFTRSEWSKQDYVDYTLLSVRNGVQAPDDAGALEVLADVAQAVNEAKSSARDTAATVESSTHHDKKAKTSSSAQTKVHVDVAQAVHEAKSLARTAIRAPSSMKASACSSAQTSSPTSSRGHTEEKEESPAAESSVADEERDYGAEMASLYSGALELVADVVRAVGEAKSAAREIAAAAQPPPPVRGRQETSWFSSAQWSSTTTSRVHADEKKQSSLAPAASADDTETGSGIEVGPVCTVSVVASTRRR
ncbi:hypothetical protein LTR85_001469 [Meristemomyces frigidus]|nr:hypothetical protein LTR85_001469 [Meristemomyces frigidus]